MLKNKYSKLYNEKLNTLFVGDHYTLIMIFKFFDEIVLFKNLFSEYDYIRNKVNCLSDIDHIVAEIEKKCEVKLCPKYKGVLLGDSKKNIIFEVYLDSRSIVRIKNNYDIKLVKKRELIKYNSGELFEIYSKIKSIDASDTVPKFIILLILTTIFIAVIIYMLVTKRMIAEVIVCLIIFVIVLIYDKIKRR